MERVSKNWAHTSTNQYLTSRSHSLIIKSIKYGSTFRLHPFVWDQQTQRIEPSSDKARLAVWHFNALAMISYFGFVVFRAVQTFRDDTSSPRDIILAGFGVAFYLFPATVQLTYMFYGDEFPGLVNQCLKLLSDLNRTIPPANLRPNQRYPIEVRLSELFACNIYYGFQGLAALVLIFGYELPGTKFMVSSLHQDPHDLENPYRLLSFSFLLYITENYVIASWAIGICATIPFPMCVALEALSHRHLTLESLHTYRCIQLWTAKFNRIYSPLMLPMAEIIMMAFSTFGIVGVIRYPGVVGAVVGSVGVTGYVSLYLLLRFYGTINDKSRATLERWKFEARGPHARELRALQPISIAIGNYCFIDRSLILTATNLIANNSITLLLAT